VESMGNSLRAGIFHTLRGATARGRKNIQHRSASPRIFVGADASDGTSGPRTQFRRGVINERNSADATLRSGVRIRNWMHCLRRKIGIRARRRSSRSSNLEWRWQCELRRRSLGAGGEVRINGTRRVAQGVLRPWGFLPPIIENVAKHGNVLTLCFLGGRKKCNAGNQISDERRENPPGLTKRPGLHEPWLRSWLFPR
jgi:hypothetical protein